MLLYFFFAFQICLCYFTLWLCYYSICFWYSRFGLWYFTFCLSYCTFRLAIARMLNAQPVLFLALSRLSKFYSRSSLTTMRTNWCVLLPSQQSWSVTPQRLISTWSPAPWTTRRTRWWDPMSTLTSLKCQTPLTLASALCKYNSYRIPHYLFMWLMYHTTLKNIWGQHYGGGKLERAHGNPTTIIAHRPLIWHGRAECFVD